MVLHYKYPRYLEDGATALTTVPPAIYSSVASPLGVIQHLCRQLGLPLSCVRPVPVNTLFGRFSLTIYLLFFNHFTILQVKKVTVISTLVCSTINV